MSVSPLSRRLFLRQAALSSAAAGLAGCGGISALAPPAPQVYELTPKNTFASDLPKATWQLLVESFENTGKIVSVGRQISGLRANYVLQPEIREFRAERWEGQPYRVRVRIGAKLVRFPQRTIIGGESFERVVEVKGPDFTDVIRAWDEALGGVMKQVVEWTLRTGEGDDRAAGRPRRQV